MTGPKILQSVGESAPSGDLLVRKSIPEHAPWFGRELTLDDITRWGYPQDDLSPVVHGWRERNLENLVRGERQLRLATEHELSALFGELFIRVLRANGDVENYGLASLRVVTTAGVNFIVDAFQNLTEVENFKFHGIGTGTTAEAVGDTALVTEITTGLNPDNTRATGTQTENAANIYETVATNEVDAAVAVTEHGIFTQAATGGGTLLDRSKFDAVNLAIGDRIETTYRFTVTAGS